MREINMNTASSRVNSQTTNLNRTSDSGIQRLKNDFEHSLKAADEAPRRDQEITQDNTETNTKSDSDDILNEKYEQDSAELLWGSELVGDFREALSGELTGRDTVAGQPSLTDSISADSSWTAEASTVWSSVSKLLAQMDQVHSSRATQRWQFDWINGGVLKMSLRISRTTEGDFGITIGECESDYCRGEFIDELNRRLEEKQYRISVISEND